MSQPTDHCGPTTFADCPAPGCTARVSFSARRNPGTPTLGICPVCRSRSTLRAGTVTLLPDSVSTGTADA